MKTPEKYLEEANRAYKNSVKMEDVFVNEKAAINAIKKARIDAIEETVKECVKNLELSYASEIVDIPEDNSFEGNWEYGYYYVDKESILQVAEQLKKEL